MNAMPAAATEPPAAAATEPPVGSGSHGSSKRKGEQPLHGPPKHPKREQQLQPPASDTSGVEGSTVAAVLQSIKLEGAAAAAADSNQLCSHL